MLRGGGSEGTDGGEERIYDGEERVHFDWGELCRVGEIAW